PHVPWREMIYTGPIDAYFDHAFGKLPYRSLEFRHETLAKPRVQAVGTINYPNDHAYTRITEFKHLTGQVHDHTSVVYEYPRAEGDPYYPIPRPENAARYELYRDLAKRQPRVHFVGRLATYRYYNMDQVVAQALKLYGELAARDDGEMEATHGAANGHTNGRTSGNGRSIEHAATRGLGGDRVHGEPGR
ncbi:MAG TPA: UDP-galactopyranose mutase, partial [Kofleriaceae bacterium]